MTVSMNPDAYNELRAYTMTHAQGREFFIHQYVVDAAAAQGARTRNLTLTFALVGLYLHIGKKYTGRRIQKLHIRLARQGPAWPPPVLPDDRGQVTLHLYHLYDSGFHHDNDNKDQCLQSAERVFRSF